MLKGRMQSSEGPPSSLEHQRSLLAAIHTRHQTSTFSILGAWLAANTEAMAASPHWEKVPGRRITPYRDIEIENSLPSIIYGMQVERVDADPLLEPFRIPVAQTNLYGSTNMDYTFSPPDVVDFLKGFEETVAALPSLPNLSLDFTRIVEA
jgi:hypothetical protein